MGHIRCLEGYDRASKWYSEKQRGTVLGSEAISLVSYQMTYNPPPRPIALSNRIMNIPRRASMVPWLLHYPRCPKKDFQFSPCFLYSAAGNGLVNVAENHTFVPRARYLRLLRPRRRYEPLFHPVLRLCSEFHGSNYFCGSI